MPVFVFMILVFIGLSLGGESNPAWKPFRVCYALVADRGNERSIPLSSFSKKSNEMLVISS